MWSKCFAIIYINVHLYYIFSHLLKEKFKSHKVNSKTSLEAKRSNYNVSELAQKFFKRKSHSRVFSRFCTIKGKQVKTSSSSSSQVLTAHVGVSGQQGSCQGRRGDLTRSLKRITNENTADFHIYFWPRGYSLFNKSREPVRIKISVHWKWPLFANQMTFKSII